MPMPLFALIAAVILAAGVTIWLATPLIGTSGLAFVLPVTCLAALLIRSRRK
ncbi:hypothetical protein ABMC88_09580 [Sulfitobacter sp. HNIBRBA2951]|uniref:hypothetical protein n=1 Tax=Sulfitobacter aquimarinus TaxID=3158557 RepID=UPI0032DFFC55